SIANSQIQLANVQRERDESRRNAHRLLQRYNTKTERSRRRVNNLNQQILALQNNPPLQEFRQWCESAGLDPAANARIRVRIHGIFETLLEDDARDWYETHIKGKNWKC
ncbi:8139_t:CDS:2, partial [Rhizophagus irregularis]